MSDSVPRIDRQLTTDIVAAFARNNQVPAEQLASLISTVHQTLAGLAKPNEEAVERTPAVSIRRSVHRDYVTCMECGWRGSMMRRHLSGAHGLTPAGYRARWRLSSEHPLTAPAYSERRSKFAKQIGLGQHPRSAPAAAQPPRKTASKARSRKTASRGPAKWGARRRLKRA
jgi:predicted transcriptional regulator